MPHAYGYLWFCTTFQEVNENVKNLYMIFSTEYQSLKPSNFCKLISTFGRMQLLNLDSAAFFRHFVKNLHIFEMRDLNQFLEGIINSKFLSQDNILKKEATKSDFSKVLRNYLNNAVKDHHFYNNYP